MEQEDEMDVSYQDEYDLLMDVLINYPETINIEKLTFDLYIEAQVLVVTRVFGYSLPNMILAPFADCANHHTTDNQYELCNLRLERAKLEADAKGEKLDLNEADATYFTQLKRRINFTKHYEEDDKFVDQMTENYKTRRY